MAPILQALIQEREKLSLLEQRLTDYILEFP